MVNPESADLKKIGLLLDDQKINFWQFRQIQTLLKLENIQLDTIYIYVHDKKFERPNLVATLNRFLIDVLYFNADFLKDMSIDEQLKIFKDHSLKVELISQIFELTEKIKESNTDSIINLSSKKIDSSFHQTDSFLEYYFLFGEETPIFNLNEKIFLLKSEIKIQLIQRQGAHSTVLKSGSVLKHGYSAAETINSCGMMTFDWLGSVIGGDELKRSPFIETVNDNSELSMAQTLSIFRKIAVKRLHHIYVRLKRSITYQQWNIGYLNISLKDLTTGSPGIENTKNIKRNWIFDPSWPKSYADPFLLAVKENLYVIFEDFDFKTFLGKVSYVELSKDFKKVKDHEPKVILNRKTHFSFPSVFEFDNKTYLVPEHISSKDIVLHELNPIDFSIRSTICLLSGEYFVDPSLLFYDKKFWIFCGKWDSFSHGSSKLYIYYADQLEGPYKPHLQNPIVTDFNTARPAGSVFRYNDQIFRPSQNCLGHYGKELNIFKIKKLTETRYEEELVNVIKPDAKYNMGCHHITILNDRVIVDGRRERLSLKSFYFKLKYFLMGDHLK